MARLLDGAGRMIVNVSEFAADVMLDALGSLLGGGSLELLDASGGVLAVLGLSTPAAMDASGGVLVLNEISGEPSAPASGTAVAGRLLAADGTEICSCDVGPENSDAVIRLNGTTIAKGIGVQIGSFRLAMP